MDRGRQGRYTPNNKDLTINVAKTTIAGKYTVIFIATSGPYEVRKNVTLEIAKGKTTTGANGDNSMMLVALVFVMIVVIAVIVALAYVMSRRKLKAAAEEPYPVAPKARASDMENYDTEGGASYGRPEAQQVKSKPHRAPRPAPVPVETVPEVPEPVVEEPAPVEEEPIQTQEEVPEEPPQVEEAPEEPEAPEPKKEEESIDDILRKLKGS